MIRFIKIGPYSPIKDGLSKFNSLKLLTLNKYDPSIDKTQSEIFDIDSKKLENTDFVFYSSLNRSIETFNFLTKTHFKKDVRSQKTNLINEILFDIEKMCSLEEYEEEGSNIIRERFIDFFIKDKLFENRKAIKNRMDKFVNLLNPLNNINVLCISHTFFITIFNIYCKHPELLTTRPELLKKHIDSKERIMKFFEIKNNPFRDCF